MRSAWALLFLVVMCGAAACGGTKSPANPDGGSGSPDGPIAGQPDAAPHADARIATPDAMCGTGGGHVVFAKSFANATALGVAADGAGNVAITGNFAGSVDFGGGSLASNGGSVDAFVAVYDSAGAHKFSKSFGSASSNETGEGVAMDSTGNVFAVGDFDGSIDFGGGTITGTQTKGSTFLVKLDPTGAHVFDKHFDVNIDHDVTTTLQRQVIAVDGAGAVYVSGAFIGTITIDGTTLVAPKGNVGNSIYVAKWNAAGALQFAIVGKTTGTSNAHQIAVDGASGNILMAGQLNGTIDFGGTTPNPYSSTGINNDIFVEVLDPTAKEVLGGSIGNSEQDFGRGVGAASGGELYLTAQTQDPSTLKQFVFVGRMKTDGTFAWQKGFQANLNDSSGLATDSTGNVVVGGFVTGSTNFGCGSHFVFDKNDAFVVKLDPSGVFQWARQFGDQNGSTAQVFVNGVATDSTGVLAAGSLTSGSVVFDGTTLTSPSGTTSAILLRLSP